MKNVLLAFAFSLVAACACCGPPPMPKGPPPEYEDPPAPSWFEAGAPAAPPTISPTPAFPDAG